ncbi:sialate O-acetylesterase [Mariniflexile gromovii]|uniref:Sialate O-acetylesterase domain-containing protein n=1 Tax=Mariniflexile gromovii TaxID=362523 RepID=A0ABS4BTE3_9FLAO|nr:sialate O-acetylesterase [Mariniflexile gromovii]MBP0903848.1 hypothetical protein [Mariniflexile gromovii]
MSFVVFCILIFNTAFALEIDLPSIFSNGMVLQQGQKVPIWGTTEANAIIEVLFAEQKKEIKADTQGNWRVDLDALDASSESRILSITAQYKNEVTTLKFVDVLVGEVWLCSGQSNMYRSFRMLIGEAVEPKYEPIAEYLRKEAATANDPLFRQFKVGQDFSVFKEKTQGTGEWSKAVPGQVNEFSGTAYFFGRELREKLQVPVAIISCNFGGTKIEPWMPISAYKSNETFAVYYNNEIADYQKRLASWEEGLVNRKGVKQVHPAKDKQVPATLYNAMIHPLIPYAVKGALWYQGESNSSELAEQYGVRLQSMIENWRAAWGQETFYFYTCQLANYRKANEMPVGDEDGWALVSYGQSQILELPNTGLAVLNDIGESKAIHPKNKVDAGKRLSLWALKQAYNKDIVCSGPLYKSSEIKNNKIIIEFNHVGSGLMVGKKHLLEPTVPVNEPLKRFQICDESGVWKWAKAQIIDKNKVEVWHNEISNPIEVRYAWSSNPEGANLYNKEGLPASILKTSN